MNMSECGLPEAYMYLFLKLKNLSFRSLNISQPSSASDKVPRLLLLRCCVNPGDPIEAFKAKPSVFLQTLEQGV